MDQGSDSDVGRGRGGVRGGRGGGRGGRGGSGRGGGSFGGGDVGSSDYVQSLSRVRGSSRGRPPMFGRAMTAAEKMRRSRQRKLEAMGEVAYRKHVKQANAHYNVSVL